ncbi:phage tail tape measure protein [Tellurirhabdus bombi]|uniref:phage tail tape measure protein n=1 Tax=Tellurirhabdus bombi TaxID=2907205 RepID=UPI001F1D4569|nr:phage tail tape measure protein [Tellurirhabdus bombi]
MSTQNEKAVIDLVVNGRQSETSLKEVATAAVNARKELNKMREADDPKAYAEKLKQVRLLNQAQREMTGRINETASAWDRFKKNAGSTLTGIVGGNLITSGLQQLVGIIPMMVDKNMALKDSFADIEKSTGMSGKEVDAFNEKLKKINTRTATKDLRDIAVVGGQLGVATAQMEGFVENADKASVALGDEFGSVEEVAKATGTMAKLFKETRDLEIGQSINDIGSALNELGAQGSATAPVVSDFTMRMGQLGDLAPKIAETMGLGAALQELGLSAEIGAGGLSNILLTAAKDTGIFAQQLGITEKEMKDLINTNPNEFLLQLADSLKGVPADQLAKRLDDLGIKSQEATKVMSLLANQTDFVRQKQDLANQAMIDGTSLTNEFNKKNHDLAVNLKRLSEWFDDLLTGQGMRSFTAAIVGATTSLLGLNDASQDSVREFKTTQGEVKKLESTLNPLLTRYDELKKKTNLSKGEQTEMKKVLGQIVQIVPLAANEFDKYGNIIGVSTTKAREFIETQKAMMKYQNQNAIDETSKKLNNLRSQYGEVDQAIRTGQKEVGAISADDIATTHKLTNEEMKQALERRKAIGKQIVESKRLLGGLQGDYLDQATTSKTENAPATGTGKPGGSATANPDKINTGKKNKSNKLSQEQKDLNELNKLLEKSRQENLEDAGDAYQKEQIQFGFKYKKMIELAHGNEAKIAEIREVMYKELEQLQNKHNEIEWKQTVAQTEKELEWEKKSQLADISSTASKADQLKQEYALEQQHLFALLTLHADNEEKVKELRAQILLNEKTFNQQRRDQDIQDKDAQLQRELDLNLNRIDRADFRNGDIDDVFRDEERYAAKKESLEKLLALYQNDATKKREIADQLAKLELDHDEQVRASRWNAVNEGLEAAKFFFKGNVKMMKAIYVAQQAMSIGKVLFNLYESISDIVAFYSGMGPLGTAPMAAQIGITTAKAAMNIGQIRAQKFEAPAFADGGFTGMVESNQIPSGYVGRPTFFNQGKRSYIAGEAGTEFILSNESLRNPVVADLARAMNALQLSGQIRGLSYSSQPASTGAGAATVQPVIVPQGGVEQRLDVLISHIDALANRPIENNYRVFEEYENRVQGIRQETSI